MERYFVYILACSDGSLYTGYTANVERRLARHRSGRGSKYVASRLPVALAYLEEAASRKNAMKREYEIKHMGREGKLRLCGEQSGETERLLRVAAGGPRVPSHRSLSSRQPP